MVENSFHNLPKHVVNSTLSDYSKKILDVLIERRLTNEKAVESGIVYISQDELAKEIKCRKIDVTKYVNELAFFDLLTYMKGIAGSIKHKAGGYKLNLTLIEDENATIKRLSIKEFRLRQEAKISSSQEALEEAPEAAGTTYTNTYSNTNSKSEIDSKTEIEIEKETKEDINKDIITKLRLSDGSQAAIQELYIQEFWDRYNQLEEVTDTDLELMNWDIMIDVRKVVKDKGILEQLGYVIRGLKRKGLEKAQNKPSIAASTTNRTFSYDEDLGW